MSYADGKTDEPMEPVIDVVTDSIDTEPDHSSAQTQTLPTATANDDLPGPSTTFIPRQPSPPLPDLRRRPFPPDEASDDEDDEDEVVAALPIYLSPALYPQLQLFQYPLHRQIHTPTWASDRGKGITSRVKEGVGRIEVEIPVDAGPEVWRDERARELGFVADVNAVNGSGDLEGGYGFGGRSEDKKKGGKGKKEKEKKEKWGEKMRLRSEAVPGATGYYSGMIHDGALHLHPISKFVQLRTSLGYLDDFEQAQREASARYRRGGDDEEGEEKKAKAAPTRQSKLPQDEENDGSGSIKDFRNKMWSMAQRESEDKWVPYEWLEGGEPSVLEKLEKLIVAPENQERLTCTTRGLDYLNKAGI